MGLSAEQLELRRTRMAATDVAAVVGVHPFRSIIDVWRDKRGESEPWVDTPDTLWGNRLEPALRAEYAERNKVRLEIPGTLVHPDHDWMCATPDAIVYQEGQAEPDRGLECKQHGWRMGAYYGDPGTDDIPLYELCQCAWNLAVTGLTRWDLIACVSGPPQIYVVDRDDEVIGDLMERCHRFLIDNVRGGAVPDPDGHDRFDSWLKARWAENTKLLIDIGEDNDTFTLIERAKQIRAQATDLDDEHAAIVQTLKLKIGGAEGLTWRDAKGKHKVTWKRNKPSKKVDYHGIANDARNDARLVLSAHQRTIDRALTGLKVHGHTVLGENSRETITGAEVFGLVESMASSLEKISRRTDAAYTKEIPGNRPFNWPISWRSPRERKEQDS